MTGKELLERCHNGECLCDACERRFICWTSKRVFSDPTHQALYEAHIAEGMSHEDALAEVKAIERAILEAAIREERDKKKPWYDEWKDSWKPSPYKPQPPKFPPYDRWVRWQSDMLKTLPLDDARKELKDLRQYFRSCISGKST